MANQYQNFSNPTIIPDQKYGWEAASQGIGGAMQAFGDYFAQRQQEHQKLSMAIALAQGQAQAEQQAKLMAQQQDPMYRLRMQSLQNQQMPQSSQTMSSGSINFNPLNPITQGQNVPMYIEDPNFAWGGNNRWKENPEFKRQAEREDKPPTQFQETTGLYANRLEQANKIFDNLNSFTSNMNAGDQAQIGLPGVMNTFKSKDVQSYQQAERNFINATLRRESGATINADERADARQQYIPQPGDTSETLAQKKANRDLIVQSFIKSSGKSYTPYNAQQPSTGQNIPSRDEIMAELQRRQQAQK